MAYLKQCDCCSAELDVKGQPYLQIHGSISEQVKTPRGEVEYRYLTDYGNTKLAFCGNTCLVEWLDFRRGSTPFVPRAPRPGYPQ